MGNLVRFTVIAVVLAAAILLILAVGGALSSDALWHSAAKIAELIGIFFVTMAVILAVTKK